MPFRVAADVLRHLLPAEVGMSPETLRAHTLKIGEQLCQALSQISSVDDRNPESRTGLFRQGIELLRGPELACEQQLALPDHVH
jgi:hypothetical protein